MYTMEKNILPAAALAQAQELGLCAKQSLWLKHGFCVKHVCYTNHGFCAIHGLSLNQITTSRW